MPTYIYETTDPTKPRRELEIKQSVHDDPILIDPQTGEAIRRIISAGYSILVPRRIDRPVCRIVRVTQAAARIRVRSVPPSRKASIFARLRRDERIEVSLLRQGYGGQGGRMSDVTATSSVGEEGLRRNFLKLAAFAIFPDAVPRKIFAMYGNVNSRGERLHERERAAQIEEAVGTAEGIGDHRSG